MRTEFGEDVLRLIMEMIRSRALSVKHSLFGRYVCGTEQQKERAMQDKSSRVGLRRNRERGCYDNLSIYFW